MTPIRFGPPASQLYGCLHRPALHTAEGKAVLLCNPFGQEAVRLHKLYRVLAERLSRQGHAVLRFDYLGTGDSDGDDETPGLEQWIRDLLLAHRELLSRTGRRPVLWIGARLGAWLAARASSELDEPLDGLALWAPILDGHLYLNDLACAHTKAQYNLLLPAVAPSETLGKEALGFAVSDSFKHSVRKIVAADYLQTQAKSIWIIANPSTPQGTQSGQSLRTALPDAEYLPLDLSFDWTSEEALNAALVPSEAVHLLGALVSGGPI